MTRSYSKNGVRAVFLLSTLLLVLWGARVALRKSWEAFLPLFVILILLASVLYTLAIFGERFAGQLKAWMLIAFEFAFIADVAGTLLMARRASGVSLHGILGCFALVIMSAHLIWAFWAAFRNDRARELFHANSWKAWLVWMAAFLSGALLR